MRKGRYRRLAVATLVLATAVVLTIAIVPLGTSGTINPSGHLVKAVASTPPAPPGIFVAGDELSGPNSTNPALQGRGPQKLALAASAPLLGGGDPVASPSRDQKSIAYNTWTWLREVDWSKSFDKQGIRTGDPLALPQIYVRNLGRKSDVALEPGSFSMAWRADGALAYALGLEPQYRANTPYLTHVLVRASIDAQPVVWATEPDRYFVAGWAGDSLIVERQNPDASPDVIALDGVDQFRTLAAHAALLGVSPDGTQLLVATTRADTPTPAVELVRVSDALVLASLPLDSVVDPTSHQAMQWVAGPADWKGDSAVISSSSGLLVLHVEGTSVDVEQVMHLDSATQPNGMLWEPRFAGKSNETVVTWEDVPASSGPWHSAQLVCNRQALACAQGPEVAVTKAPRPVFDRSGGK